jgi:pimeloyl-ACP methyl ester carboxylesterase
MKRLSISSLIFLSCLIVMGQPSTKKRPQTPKPPYPYHTDSVEYENEDHDVHLAATFSYPNRKGPFVTAVMITGSGQQDRDETIFDHHPFAVIADYLTRHGYAVLRVDDRGKGKSHGNLMNVTSLDFTNDVLTSIHYLLTRKEVNPKKIGVIGHSEGGFIAPILYSRWPNLAFIISLAGTGVPGSEILLKQQTDPLKGLVGPVVFNAYYDLTIQTLAVIHDNPNEPDSAILSSVKKIYHDWKTQLPDSILIPLHADQASPEAYAVQIKQELIPWLRYFIATDPYLFWKQVKCPVLALNGSKDIQVYAEENTKAIEAALKEADNEKATIKIFPGLNHLFQHCIECTVPEYDKIEETFSPEVLTVMEKWLKKTIGTR